jgi:hypothetical protein
MEVVESTDQDQNTFTSPREGISKDETFNVTIEHESHEILSYETLAKFLPKSVLSAIEHDYPRDGGCFIEECTLREQFQNDTSLSPLSDDELKLLDRASMNPIYSKVPVTTDNLRHIINEERKTVHNGKKMRT